MGKRGKKKKRKKKGEMGSEKGGRGNYTGIGLYRPSRWP
jgi:hypothetical protein